MDRVRSSCCRHIVVETERMIVVADSSSSNSIDQHGFALDLMGHQNERNCVALSWFPVVIVLERLRD
jgi:hypothetical protein